MLKSSRVASELSLHSRESVKSMTSHHGSASEPKISLPLTPQTVLSKFYHHLSPYERQEILSYREIYYWGQNTFENDSKGKVGGHTDDPKSNYGYDDTKGDYRPTIHDHFAYRYEIIDTLGKGSFGQVFKCFDHKTKDHVAVKIIRNKKRFTMQGEVEVKILKNVKDSWDPHDTANIVHMIDHFKFRQHLCIAFELLSINLYEFIKSNGFRGFSLGLIRRFSVQLLQCLSLLWKNKVVHCDLKPENVLLKCPTRSCIKVIDFGSSCLESERVYTYIQSRFYRSPEVILGLQYNMSIDMWSLGCILCELYTGYPIFPGENEHEQLVCMMEILGVPGKSFLAKSERRNQFFDASYNPLPFVNSKGRRRKIGSKNLSSALKCTDELFIDFLMKCFTWDPEKRMTPLEALQHEWITSGNGTCGNLEEQKSSSGQTNISSGASKNLSLSSASIKSSYSTIASSRMKSQISHKPRNLPPISAVSSSYSRSQPQLTTKHRQQVGTHHYLSSSHSQSLHSYMSSGKSSGSSGVSKIVNRIVGSMGNVMVKETSRVGTVGGGNLNVGAGMHYLKPAARKYT